MPKTKFNNYIGGWAHNTTASHAVLTVGDHEVADLPPRLGKCISCPPEIAETHDSLRVLRAGNTGSGGIEIALCARHADNLRERLLEAAQGGNFQRAHAQGPKPEGWTMSAWCNGQEQAGVTE